jgi:hypothetical protein
VEPFARDVNRISFAPHESVNVLALLFQHTRPPCRTHHKARVVNGNGFEMADHFALAPDGKAMLAEVEVDVNVHTGE